MNPTRPLRLALIGNAVFSTTCGLVMLIAPAWLGHLLGLDAPLVYQLLGVGLVVFALDLLHQASRARMATWRALYASVADFLWVLGTLVGVLLFPGALSGGGLLTVWLVAAAVLLFGVLQLRGILKVHAGSRPGLYRHCLMVAVDAPAPALWRVVGNLGEIQRYMPSLQSSELLDDAAPGVGAVRHCVDRQGKAWSEECIGFNPGHDFTVRFLADEPGFPFPASEMIGGWQVMSAEHGSIVMVWWELTPKPKWLTPALLPLLAFQADRDFTRVIGAMAHDALGEDLPPEPATGRAALLAGLC